MNSRQLHPNNFPSYNMPDSHQQANNPNSLRSPPWQPPHKRNNNNNRWGNDYQTGKFNNQNPRHMNNQYNPNYSNQNNDGDRFANRNTFSPRQNSPYPWANSPSRGRQNNYSRYGSPNFRGRSPRHGLTPRCNPNNQHQQDQPVERYFKSSMLQDPWAQLKPTTDSTSPEEISS